MVICHSLVWSRNFSIVLCSSHFCSIPWVRKSCWVFCGGPLLYSPCQPKLTFISSSSLPDPTSILTTTTSMTARFIYECEPVLSCWKTPRGWPWGNGENSGAQHVFQNPSQFAWIYFSTPGIWGCWTFFFFFFLIILCLKPLHPWICCSLYVIPSVYVSFINSTYHSKFSFHVKTSTVSSYPEETFAIHYS